MQRYFISHCVLRLISGREHHVSDYLLASIEGCGDKDQACFFVAYHDDSGWSGCSCNHGVYSRYYGQYGDSLSHTASMLWGDWRVCVIETPRSSLNKISCTRQFESKLSLRSFAKSLDKRIFSKITPSLFTLKEGSTSHPDPLSSGAREKTALLGARNRYVLRLVGHQSPRHLVRAGTAWGKLVCCVSYSCKLCKKI